MKQRTNEKARIDREVAKIKRELFDENPVCIMCLQRVYWGYFDPMHKIRRSETSKKYSTFELQTMKFNIGPAHRICHIDFDDNKKKAKTYPGYKQIMKDIKKIDIDIYNKMTYL
jgi:hypothetical protein